MRDGGAMTEDSVVSAATRIACRQVTLQHLDALQASLEQASGPMFTGTGSAISERYQLSDPMEGGPMRPLARLLEPKAVAYAHCDLPCGIYDPAQARIEAESVKAIDEKYQQNTDPEFRTRCLIIKEQRSELIKHHLWVLWTDYFKPPHFEKYPQLHTLFNEAAKLAGATVRRAAPTRPWPASCWRRSRRSARSSGKPSRTDTRPTGRLARPLLLISLPHIPPARHRRQQHPRENTPKRQIP
jgi:nickel superoxide dismutase